jgi:D-alanyl-D-alanine carboxypeptidase
MERSRKGWVGMPGFRSKSLWARCLLSAVALAGLLAAPRSAAAQIGSDRYASIVIDAGTGNMLSAVNADETRYPASLTKMMTLYMLFEALRDRRVSLDQLVPVSSWAASMPPTKLGLVPGTTLTVEQAILGLVTKSANDAAAALGELMGGDEERFAQMMTLRARALGMSRTTFRNASGLPDWGQVTTARDLAMLARHLVQDFPVQYRYFSTPSFTFHGRVIPNHQHLLETYPGADGLKTGFIKDSGYNLATSALHGSTRLIGVVMGAANGGERDDHMATLLDAGFERMGVPFMMARQVPPPDARMPSLFSTAQAAPLYSTPYDAPYLAAPYQGTSFNPLPPRGYAARVADARGYAPARQRLLQPVAHRIPEGRPDIRLDSRFDRSRVRPSLATAPRQSILVRGYEPPAQARTMRQAGIRGAAWPLLRHYPG